MVNDTPQPKQRTTVQNRALHKFFELLSDDLNTQGLDMRMVLKPSYSIWWTPEAVKRDLWKPVQELMYSKKSTTELTTAEVSKVYEQIAKILGEKFGIEMSFPNESDTESFINSLDK